MKELIKGFSYAGKGIFFCFANERNMRIHLCFTAYMFGFLKVFDFFEVSNAEIAVLLGLCALVLSLEAVNTAIERTVDLVTTEYKPLARIAKDSAAGAVLIAAVFSVIAGIVIMYQPEAFRAMFAYYRTHLYMLVILIISLVLSLLFIFLPPIIKNRKTAEKK
ncbi:MAG: diacylglycerol kinase family protein [Clostridia bacterium]|nr:diacylglycerol kinase family protein [Clostridia bacterium]